MSWWNRLVVAAGRPRALNEEAVREIIDQYVNHQKSILQLAALYKVNRAVIRNLLSRNNVPIRTVTDANNLSSKNKGKGGPGVGGILSQEAKDFITANPNKGVSFYAERTLQPFGAIVKHLIDNQLPMHFGSLRYVSPSYAEKYWQTNPMATPQLEAQWRALRQPAPVQSVQNAPQPPAITPIPLQQNPKNVEGAY